MDELLEKIKGITSKEDKIKLLNALMETWSMPSEDHLKYENLNTKIRQQFKREADLILSLPVWKWLEREMKESAEWMMFQKAETYEDMLGGKFMLYTLDVQRKKLINLAK